MLTSAAIITLLLFAAIQDILIKREAKAGEIKGVEEGTKVGTVSNGIPLVLLGIGLLTFTTLWHSLLIAYMVFILTFGIFLATRFGGADAKLLITLAFIFPHQAWTIIFVSASTFIIYQVTVQLFKRKPSGAFAPFILIGTLFILFP